MTLKNLSDILEVDKLAPIHFFRSNSEYKGPECKFMTDEELNDYNRDCLKNENNYDLYSLGIYLPNITIECLYDNELTHNPPSFNYIFDSIYDLYSVAANDNRYKIIYATFVILHEVGHWINLKKSEMSRLDYVKWDSENRYESKKLLEDIRKMPDDNPMKYKYAEKHLKIYKDIPSEKLADKYAFENLETNLYKLGIDIKNMNSLM